MGGQKRPCNEGGVGGAQPNQMAGDVIQPRAVNCGLFSMLLISFTKHQDKDIVSLTKSGFSKFIAFQFQECHNGNNYRSDEVTYGLEYVVSSIASIFIQN